MRRSDREVKDPDIIFQALEDARTVRIAYQDAEGLTIVPVTFAPVKEGEDLLLVLHGAKEGRKHAAFSKGCDVAFETEAGLAPHVSAEPGQNSWAFTTVIGHGRVSLVTDPGRALSHLRALLASHGAPLEGLRPEMADWAAVFELRVTDLACKRHA